MADFMIDNKDAFLILYLGYSRRNTIKIRWEQCR